ncbi:MAG: hypothetical protein KGZ66_01260 [Selenomonadales bacterium]|jgi:hypothetical protein|nr:hypothetical protein [Selenomonadales bacterium]
MRSVRRLGVYAAVLALIGTALLSWLYFAYWSRDEQPQGATLVYLVTSPSPQKEVQHGANR